MSNSQQKKIQLIKRLVNKGHNFQVMAINALFEFLKSERYADELAAAEYERQQKEKDRILRRIMDNNVRFMGMGFRQSKQWMEAAREAERVLIQRQRGIMNRMVDSNVRLMGAGYNKLIEEWKAKQGQLKEKLKFVIATLTDSDKEMTMMAYNMMKTEMLRLKGVGLEGDKAQLLKIKLLRKLTNQGFNLQVMAINALFEFLNSERDLDEKARLEFERQQKEKKRILARIMDNN